MMSSDSTSLRRAARRGGTAQKVVGVDGDGDDDDAEHSMIRNSKDHQDPNIVLFVDNKNDKDYRSSTMTAFQISSPAPRAKRWCSSVSLVRMRRWGPFLLALTVCFLFMQVLDWLQEDAVVGEHMKQHSWERTYSHPSNVFKQPQKHKIHPSETGRTGTSNVFQPASKYRNHPLETGLDVSEALSVERGDGQFYYPDFSPADPLAIVSQAGHEWIRVRIMVDPDGMYGLDQDLQYVVELLSRARTIDKSVKILLDFHYSHWWCDGTNQWAPSRWRDAPEPGGKTWAMRRLRPAVYSYTKQVMNVLRRGRPKGISIWPNAVQVGNEISQGMLWEEARIPLHGDWDIERPPPEWYNLQALLQSGIDAIFDVSDDGLLLDRPLIMIHLDTGGDKVLTEKWMQTYFQLGGYSDIIGLSYYPQWHGSFKDLRNNIINLSHKFPEQQVWVVETAFYYEGSCMEKDYKCHEMFPFGMTKHGQASYLRELRQMLLESTDCRALFYWGSHWTQPSLWFRTRTDSENDWDEARRRALFDPRGVVNPGICALSNSTSNFCRDFTVTM